MANIMFYEDEQVHTWSTRGLSSSGETAYLRQGVEPEIIPGKYTVWNAPTIYELGLWGKLAWREDSRTSAIIYVPDPSIVKSVNKEVESGDLNGMRLVEGKEIKKLIDSLLVDRVAADSSVEDALRAGRRRVLE